MQHVQQLAIALAAWVMNPFYLMILMASCHELRVIRHEADERHVIGFAEHGLDVMAWFAMSFCAATAMWLHRGSSTWPISAAFGGLVMLQGFVLLRRLECDRTTVIYSRVHVAQQVVYAMVVLAGGTLSFAM